MLGLRDQTRFTGIELSGNVVAPDSGSRINLSGEVQASRENFSYDLAIEADYKHIEDFLTGFESAARLLDGSLTLKGQLSGNLDGYTISAEQVIIDNMPAYGFEASGQLVQMRGQHAEISFLLNSTHNIKDSYLKLFSIYLVLIEKVARELSLHKIFTYGYNVESYRFLPLVEQNYNLDATLKKHKMINDKRCDVLIYSKLL